MVITFTIQIKTMELKTLRKIMGKFPQLNWFNYWFIIDFYSIVWFIDKLIQVQFYSIRKIDYNIPQSFLDLTIIENQLKIDNIIGK